MGFRDVSGISWTICKQSAPRSRQITTPTPHHSSFTGWTLFLTDAQQTVSKHWSINHNRKIKEQLKLKVNGKLVEECLSPGTNIRVYVAQTDAFSALTLLVGRQEGNPACKKLKWWGVGVVICLEQGADLHTAQLMPLPLTASCFSKIQMVLPFWYRRTRGSPGQRAVKRACVCVCI